MKASKKLRNAVGLYELIEIIDNKTGEIGVADVTPSGAIRIYIGPGDGSQDRNVSDEYFDEHFEIFSLKNYPLW